MKTPLHIALVAACLGLTACNRQPEANREIVGKLDEISSQLNKGPAPVRWATASKSDIQTAIYIWSRDKMEAAKKAEALPVETEAKIAQYESLRMEMLQMRMPMLPPRAVRLPGTAAPEPTAAEKEYDAMAKRVADAKAPVAEIIDRRERQAAKLREQYTVESLIAEYVKDRYDLVVDSRDKVLYHTGGEFTDITDGVMALFKEKTKQ